MKLSLLFLCTGSLAAAADGDCTEAMQRRFDIVLCSSHQCNECSLSHCIEECQHWQKQFPNCRCEHWPEDQKVFSENTLGHGKSGDIGDYGADGDGVPAGVEMGGAAPASHTTCDAGRRKHAPHGAWNAGRDAWKQGFTWQTLSKDGSLGTVLFEFKDGHIAVDAGKAMFNGALDKPPHALVRTCPGCQADYRELVYVRTSTKPFDAYDTLLNNWFSCNNKLHEDFELYGSVGDALEMANAWNFCNYDDPGVGFPRDCGRFRGVGGQWNSRR